MSDYDRWFEHLPYPVKVLLVILSYTGKILNGNNTIESFLVFFLYHYETIILVVITVAIGGIVYDVKYRGTLKIYDYLFEAIEGIKENKIRSFFSIFGLSLGIASAIGILSLGQATGGLIDEKRTSRKDISYIFSLYSSDRGAGHFLAGVCLTAGDLIDIKNRCSSVEKIVPYIGRGKVSITFNHQIAEATLIGTSGEYELTRSPVAGRFFTYEDLENKNRVCVITSDRLKT